MQHTIRIILIVVLSLPVSTRAMAQQMTAADWHHFTVGMWTHEQTSPHGIGMTVVTRYHADGTFVVTSRTKPSVIAPLPQEFHVRGIWRARGIINDTCAIMYTSNVSPTPHLERFRRVGRNAVRNESFGFIAYKLQ